MLSVAERGVLVAVLSYADFAGRESLLVQIDAVRVVGRCDCGCATVDLAVENALTSDAVAYPISNEATVLDARGDAIGGVLVFVRDGYLARLEVYSGAGQTISSFPRPHCGIAGPDTSSCV